MKTVFSHAQTARLRLKSMPVAERLAYIRRLRELVLEEREAIMDRIQADTQKCRTDALMSEIFPVLEHLHYLETRATQILKDRKASTPLALMGKKSWVYFEPLGTVLVISPWNYPFYQAVVPCTLSFICGNATIYKPSEHTPLKGLVEGLLKRAGFDENWIQVVYGDGATGSALIAEKPQKIFFTGSVKTGKRILAQASEHLIPVELELGGKDPMIVFEDVNIERAAAGAAWGKLTNSGQSCTSVERLYVHESIYAPFKAELTRIWSACRLGVDQEGEAEFGEMTVPFQTEILARQLERAEKAGARVLTGKNWDRQSRRVPPILIEAAGPEQDVVREESFGPILPIIPFKTEAEVIAAANDSDYGLSASVWSKDLKRATRVARALETGNVSINNVMLSEGNHALPFGGVKQSGIGRYKGEFGFYSFSNIKSVLIDADSRKIEANWYPFSRRKYELFTKMMVGLFRGGISGLIQFALNGLALESHSQKAAKGVRPKLGRDS